MRHPVDDHGSGAADTRQVLFIQGGGEGTHDAWDHLLVESLRSHLGTGYEVRYPRMPGEADPDRARWGEAIGRELDDLDEGAAVVGHSVGGTLLVQTLLERPPAVGLAAIVLVATPFVGPGGWPGEGFAFGPGLGARLPAGVPVHVVHGTADDSVPPRHTELFAEVIPGAHLHLLPGRDHQLGNDLSEVARLLRG